MPSSLNALFLFCFAGSLCLFCAAGLAPPVLVTGGAGYIGSHTCLALLEAGRDVSKDRERGGEAWTDACVKAQTSISLTPHAPPSPLPPILTGGSLRRFI